MPTLKTLFLVLPLLSTTLFAESMPLDKYCSLTAKNRVKGTYALTHNGKFRVIKKRTGKKSPEGFLSITEVAV